MSYLPLTPIDQEAAAHSLPSVGRAAGAATRHLCAAPYLDDGFRDWSLREVYYQPRRMVAPSYGFDLILTLRHCLRARNATLIRDALIVICFAFVCAARPVAAFLFACAVVTLLCLSKIPTSPAGFIRVTIFVCIVWCLLSAAIVSWTGGDTLGSAISSAPTILNDIPLLALVPILAIALALPAATRLWGQRQVDRIVGGNSIANDPPRAGRLAQIDLQRQGNTVAYSGPRTFVGSGQIVSDWGRFTVPLRSGNSTSRSPEQERQPDAEPPCITTVEIFEYVELRITSLAQAQEPLRGLTVARRVYQSAYEVTRLWPNTSPDRVMEVLRNPGPSECYLVCQIVSSQGELVTTIHVHLAVAGDTLHVRLTSTALLPCQERYEAVDHVNHTGLKAYPRVLQQGLRETPQTIALAPINLIQALEIVGAVGWAYAARKNALRGFKYGARTSMRELAMAKTTRNYGQWQEIEKYRRILEQQVMAAVADFLDEHDIDTGGLRQWVTYNFYGETIHAGSGDINQPAGPQHKYYWPPGPATDRKEA